jgi:hypothetical protein
MVTSIMIIFIQLRIIIPVAELSTSPFRIDLIQVPGNASVDRNDASPSFYQACYAVCISLKIKFST